MIARTTRLAALALYYTAYAVMALLLFGITAYCLLGSACVAAFSLLRGRGCAADQWPYYPAECWERVMKRLILYRP